MKNLHRIIALSFAAISTLYATDTLSAAFSKGKASAQIRAYYMVEDNHDDLQDYFGFALGGKLKYETAAFYGLKTGAAFYTTHFINDNVSTANGEPTANNKGSRYVAGLVDAENHDNGHVTGLGELYLSYTLSKTSATYGRMKLNTPFINPEDGRMIPTLEQGVWLFSKDIPGVVLQGGFLSAFWNRSTAEWKSAESSLGYGYAQGKAPLEGNTNGAYKGNTTTDGVYVGSATYAGVEGVTLQVWDYYVENIFNTFYLQGDYVYKSGEFKLLAALQYIGQKEVGDGGNGDDNVVNPTAEEQARSYMLKDEKSNTYGGKIGVGYAGTMLAFAATQTTDEGRFLFPREWGKEPLFTFQKRERSDGSGDTTAWLLTLEQDFEMFGIKGLSTKIGAGKYYKPDAKNFVLNKYGIPSYAQMNIDTFYKCYGALKGLKFEYLFARKYALGETYETATNSNFVFAKNAINIHNFVLNYSF